MWKTVVGSVLVVTGLFSLLHTAALLSHAAVFAKGLPSNYPLCIDDFGGNDPDFAVSVRREVTQRVVAADRRNAFGLWLPIGAITTAVGVLLLVGRRRSIRRVRELT
ncbi:MAG: hypothetical protein WCP21_03950 [Armatimonadota bacterium]